MNAICRHPSTCLVDEVVELDITVFRNRLQDPDNAIASLKPLIDAIKCAGWLVDDDCARLVLKAQQVKCTKVEQRTEVKWRITQ